MARSCEDLRTGEAESNPFLFSNFMKKDSTDNVAAQVWKNFDSSNESVDHAPFPDLCRIESKQKTRAKVPRKSKAKTKTEGKRRVLKIVDDEIQTVNEAEVDKLIQQENAGIESIGSSSSGSENEAKSPRSSARSSPQGSSYVLPESDGFDTNLNQDPSSKLQKLERENKVLRMKMKTLEEEMEKEREASKMRVNNLVDELRAARKKEVEETATLENVVQMVEENLRQTTQRAVKAEASVSRLKDELKFLKEETVPKSRHVRLVAEYESTLESIRQKSKDASTVMLTAANKNEPLLKELLSGISSLRLLAQQFESIDKIADVDPTRDRIV